MLKSQIRPGIEYALREKRTPGTRVQQVRVISHARGNKWKAEWIDPSPGLTYYVTSVQLIAPWKEHKAVLKEEADDKALRERDAREGYRKDSPLERALEVVFESTGDSVTFCRGSLIASQESIDRLTIRAGADCIEPSPDGYVDRQGRLHIPYVETLELAQMFCAAEPATVLARCEATEREWARDARQPGEEYVVGLLNEYRAAWALIRQWAGHDAAVAQRETEIQRLERLVWDAVYALQKGGLDSEAARLRRALGRR